MQFETEEPTHRAFTSLGYAFENFVNMYSPVFADTQWCTVNYCCPIKSFFDRYAVLLERAKSKGLISFCEVSP